MAGLRDQRRRAREAAIVTAARTVAESEGWAAVTTRRLAAEVGYSQPVLYTHFDSMEAIVAAVAVEGAAEMAARLRRAARGAKPVERVARAYLRFAREHPAVYGAMSSRAKGLAFGTSAAPSALREAFAPVLDVAGGNEARAELLWATLHGLVELERDGRLRPSAAVARIRELTAIYGGAGLGAGSPQDRTR